MSYKGGPTKNCKTRVVYVIGGSVPADIDVVTLQTNVEDYSSA